MLRKLPHSKSAPLECASLSLLAPCGAAACCRAREMYAHSRWRALFGAAGNRNKPPGAKTHKGTLGLSRFRRLARIHLLRMVQFMTLSWSFDVLLCLHGVRSQPGL
jgi:hypothetical protein